MSNVIPESQIGGMVRNCVAYCAEGSKVGDITLDAISDVLQNPDNSFVWLGLYEPDESLLTKLQEEFGLHPLAIEDASKAHQRAKIELYGDTLFMVVHTAQMIKGAIEFGETHIFIGPRFLITIRHGASLSYTGARARCEQNPALMAMGPSYGLYAILDFIVDNYFPIVEEFKRELNELEQDIFAESFKKDTIQHLYELKRELTTYRLAVSPTQDIVNQLMQYHPQLIRDGVKVYLRDVYDHVVRVSEATDTMREMLTAAMSVNLSLVTVAQGEIVKRLAGWAGLLAAPTLIASWYGMNFTQMPELAGKYSYLILILFTLFVTGGLYASLKKAKWL
ncbi:MAG: magnesium/cobalt transporter CorA [Arenimonas sp.]